MPPFGVELSATALGDLDIYQSLPPNSSVASKQIALGSIEPNLDDDFTPLGDGRNDYESEYSPSTEYTSFSKGRSLTCCGPRSLIISIGFYDQA